MQHLRSLQTTHLILRASDLDPATLSVRDGTRLVLVGDGDYKTLNALMPVLPSSTLLVVPLAHPDPDPLHAHTHARRAVCAGALGPEARAALVENGVAWLGDRPALAAEYRLLEEGHVAVQTVVAAEACAYVRALGVADQVAYDGMCAGQGRSWSLLNQGPYMLALATSPPGLTLQRARSALLTTLTLASSLTPPIPAPMRSSAWQSYTSTASWHPTDPHGCGDDPSATVVHGYPSPGRIAEHMAVGHNTDAPRRLEIARRLMRHAHAAALAETLGLGVRLGMKVDDLVRCLTEGPGGSWVIESMGDAMAQHKKGGGKGNWDGDGNGREGRGEGRDSMGMGMLSRESSRRRPDRTTVAHALDELQDVLDIANGIPLGTPIAGAAHQLFVLAAANGLSPESEASIARLWS